MAVRDEKSGEFRQDVKVLHVKILDTQTTNIDTETISKEFREALTAKGLQDKYIIFVSGPTLDISIETAQQIIDRLTDEKTMMTDVQKLDSIIEGLKKVREARWKKQEGQRQQ